jgi:hypothetical protein
MKEHNHNDTNSRLAWILERLEDSIKKDVEYQLDAFVLDVPPASSNNDHTVNHINGLNKFMERWDSTSLGRVKSKKDYHKSNIGNLNRDGTPSCINARIYTKKESQFENSIEPGVRSLVLKLIDKLDCITYSSCEGHLGTVDGHTYFMCRQVGILPRTLIEFGYLLTIARSIAKLTNQNVPFDFVEVVVQSRFVTSEDTTRPCLDIIFQPNDEDSKGYFRNLNITYDEFLNQLDRNIRN